MAKVHLIGVQWLDFPSKKDGKQVVGINLHVLNMAAIILLDLYVLLIHHRNSGGIKVGQRFIY